jgi:hypothetical protein
MTDFNLSDKIYENATDMGLDVVYTDDLKEFIRLLKEEIVNGIIINPEQKINKLAGEKLI